MKKNRKAQIMVEAVIGLPIFLILVLGAMEITRFSLRKLQLTYASFMANRVAIVNKGDTLAIRKAIERISPNIKDAKIKIEEKNDCYGLKITKNFPPLIPWINYDSIIFSGYSKIPKGNFQNKEIPYKYYGYSTYYPNIFTPSNYQAGILTYDRNLRAFIRQEGNPLEIYPFGGDGEAQIVRDGEDGAPRHEWFHLGAWYPPKGILRNPGEEKDRTRGHAFLDQYLFIMDMFMLKPYYSRAILGFGHGDNLRIYEYAWPYFGNLFAINYQIAEHAFTWFFDNSPFSSSGGTWIMGFGSPRSCKPIWVIKKCIWRVFKPPTRYWGFEAHYIGQGNRSWRGTRRLYDVAYYISMPLEFWWTYSVENHGRHTHQKDDLSGWCIIWNGWLCGGCCCGRWFPWIHRWGPTYERY